MSYDMDDYVDVNQRIATFRDKHPEGSLEPWLPEKPYAIEDIGGQLFVVVVAAAYRTEHDMRPGVGMAYEPFPGKTSFTRGSELQNAETSAWGRAIVAALAADTKRSVASANEVRNRNADRDAKPKLPVKAMKPDFGREARNALRETLKFKKVEPSAAKEKFATDNDGADLNTSDDVEAIRALTDHYQGMLDA